MLKQCHMTSLLTPAFSQYALGTRSGNGIQASETHHRRALGTVDRPASPESGEGGKIKRWVG